VVITDPCGDYTCYIVVGSEVVSHSITSFVESIKLLFHNLFCRQNYSLPVWICIWNLFNSLLTDCDVLRFDIYTCTLVLSYSQDLQTIFNNISQVCAITIITINYSFSAFLQFVEVAFGSVQRYSWYNVLGLFEVLHNCEVLATGLTIDLLVAAVVVNSWRDSLL